MVSTRAINQALYGFLGTFTSRYSECDGYWLLGFLVGREPLLIDLLHQSTIPAMSGDPVDVARAVAFERFKVQLSKARIERDEVQSATLRIETLGGVHGLVAGRAGRRMRFRTAVIVKGGRSVERAVDVGVAVHDPKFERQSQGRAR